MKASLKLREDHHHHHHHHQNPFLRLKIPVSIINLPFISSITVGDKTDLSFNLRTNSLSGPSLKLSYSPSSTSSPSVSLSLKSGVGLFGSPNNSPLLISANFNLFANNPNPTFSLQIKPQFGDFSLSKTAVSTALPNPNPNPNPNLAKENGGFNHLHPNCNGTIPNFHARDMFSGVAVMAKTVLPVAKRASLKFRWGVNFTTDSDDKLKLPYMTVDKISVERVELKEAVEATQPAPPFNGNVRDMELLKGMCGWMTREVEVLQKENGVIKERLDEMRFGNLGRIRVANGNAGKKVVPFTPTSEKSSEFDRWRSKKSGLEENAMPEVKQFGESENQATDVGEELKKAIAAAAMSNGV